MDHRERVHPAGVKGIHGGGACALCTSRSGGIWAKTIHVQPYNDRGVHPNAQLRGQFANLTTWRRAQEQSPSLGVYS